LHEWDKENWDGLSEIQSPNELLAFTQRKVEKLSNLNMKTLVKWVEMACVRYPKIAQWCSDVSSREFAAV
jgi:hypothetical protein